MTRLMRNALSCLAVAAAAVAPVATASATAQPMQQERGCPQLRGDLQWYGQNRARLQSMIDEQGRCGGQRGKIAVFDWDNTVVKNDVGDATFYWLLRNNGIRRPSDWRSLSPYLTKAASNALSTACGTGRTGAPLPTASDTDCADELLSIYGDAETRTGAAAYSAYNHRHTEPSYAMVASALAGYTPAQVAWITARVAAQNLTAPQGATQRVGTHDETGWVRYYPQIRNLINTMQRAGMAVWIVSASPEPVVQTWALGVGILPNRVVGIRTQREHGVLTSTLEGCGGDPTAISYIEGKRCAINTRILHNGRGFAQAPAGQRQVFGAGDSDTDATFTSDATVLRLALNRNKTELMCRAYDDADGKWLINPMFIEPKAKQASPYPCSTAGYTAPSGAKQPLVIDGRVVADQADTVFGGA